MIDKPFIFTNHSQKNWKIRFNELNFEDEIKTVVNCTKNETHSLKNTPSFKKIKKDKRSNFKFYKTLNDVYIISELKFQERTNDFANVMVTVIDILNEDSSKVTYDFKRQMIIADYELKQRSLQNDIRLKELNELKVSTEKSSKPKKESVVKLRKDEEVNEKINKVIESLNESEFLLDIIKFENLIETDNSSVFILDMLKNFRKSLNKYKTLLDFIEDETSNKPSPELHTTFNSLEKSLSNLFSVVDLGDHKSNLVFLDFIKKLLILKCRSMDLFPLSPYGENNVKFYVSNMKALVFYRKTFNNHRDFFESNDFNFNELIVQYTNFIFKYHTEEFSRIQSEDELIYKKDIKQYIEDFNVISLSLNQGNSKNEEVLDRIKKYDNFYKTLSMVLYKKKQTKDLFKRMF